jgi:hypothetical protein
MPESQPRLIGGYLQVLAAQLPGPIVEELTDGLTETYRSYRTRGLPADEAAEAARGPPWRLSRTRSPGSCP